MASVGSSQQSSTSSGGTDPATAWRQFAVCARSHGVPNLPDPVIDANGNPQFPGFSVQSVAPSVQQQVTSACGNEIQAALGTQKPPTQAEIQARVQFAQCMRQHGVPGFPDPDPLTGQFPVGPRPTDQAFAAGRQSCSNLLPQGTG